MGDALQVIVTASNSTASASASSAPSAEISAVPPANITLPLLSDITSSERWQEGDTLSVTSGSWSGAPSPKISYQWLRCNT